MENKKEQFYPWREYEKKGKEQEDEIFDYEDVLMKSLKEDDDLLDLYIKDAVDHLDETQDVGVFLLKLKHIIKAKSSINKVAKKADITSQGLDNMLKNKSFKLNTFVAVLKALKLKITIKPSLNKQEFL